MSENAECARVKTKTILCSTIVTMDKYDNPGISCNSDLFVGVNSFE